jgi:hypothetical protein
VIDPPVTAAAQKKNVAEEKSPEPALRRADTSASGYEKALKTLVLVHDELLVHPRSVIST